MIPYAGIAVSELTAGQQAQLLAVIEEWVGHMDSGHAAVKTAEVNQYLDTTYLRCSITAFKALSS